MREKQKNKLRQEVLEKYNYKCAYCGCDLTIETLQIDHIHPKYLGGLDEVNNYNPSCRSCNWTKSTYNIEEFRQVLEKKIDNLRKYTPNFQIMERYNKVSVIDNSIKFYFEKLNDN